MTGGVGEQQDGGRARERGRCRAGPGRQGEDVLRELQLPAGPVRERGEGRPSGFLGRLGWFVLVSFPFLFLIQTKLNLFEFKPHSIK